MPADVTVVIEDAQAATIHWTRGRLTELKNLILGCTFHHHQVHEGGWTIDPATRRFVMPDGTTPDPAPSARFCGSATAASELSSFDTPVPLGEARYEPFDLGLTIETLVVDENWRRELAAEAAQSPSIGRHGPPIPDDLARQREAEASQAYNREQQRRRSEKGFLGWD
jgi:hypothetical protein